MSNFFDWLINPSGLTPHGFCLLWEPGLIWTYAIADFAVGASYLVIPIALLQVARRRHDLVFKPMFYMFSAFILLCGISHWLDLLTLWVAAYEVQAIVKAATAVASIATAAMIFPLLPRVLALPSPAQMRDANEALRVSHEALETRVTERTRELVQANASLRQRRWNVSGLKMNCARRIKWSPWASSPVGWPTISTTI